jgi:hypothetical protein
MEGAYHLMKTKVSVEACTKLKEANHFNHTRNIITCVELKNTCIILYTEHSAKQVTLQKSDHLHIY